MSTPHTGTQLAGTKLAVLVANGFCEKTLTALQRSLLPMGVAIRIVSMDQGLVNSWNGETWGLNFAADQSLNQALAADYDALLVPGGQRSLDKLKLTAHTKRFINGFLQTGKPAAIADDALDLLVHIEQIAGRTVSGPQSMREAVEAAGAVWSEDAHVADGSLISGALSENPEAVGAFLVMQETLEQAA